MDAIGLTVRERELAADADVLRYAATKAAARMEERAGGHAEACAYELARFYTVLEKAFEAAGPSERARYQRSPDRGALSELDERVRRRAQRAGLVLTTATAGIGSDGRAPSTREAVMAASYSRLLGPEF
jgi:hypothetical protein